MLLQNLTTTLLQIFLFIFINAANHPLQDLLAAILVCYKMALSMV